MTWFQFRRTTANLRPSWVVPRRKTALQLEQLEDRTVPTLLGKQLFPSDNPWNQRITSAPVAGNSAAIISNIVSHYGDGRLHPDFGQDLRNSNDLYGIPYNVVHGNSVPKVQVVIDEYADESDVQMAPIVAGVVLEGDFQNGPRVGVDNRGDSHLIVWDQDNNIAYEFYRASRPSENADGKWHADQESIWDMKTNTFRTLGFTSADAAGLAILPGLVRPDEALPVSQGGQGAINHAIRFTLQNSIILDQFLYPASHTANPGNNSPSNQPPMGARFRLKAGVDISQFSPQARIVAQAMKDYGMIVADNGSNFFFSGASYAVDANNQFSVTWNDNDIQSSVAGLKALKFSDFEVVDLTPIVTGLSSSSGAAGETITVTGRNFSGAAGRHRVAFGTVASTSVTFVDDAHLLVRVPSGSGTVDVRVQSGLTTPANADNIKNTIFGYGVSAVTPADRFTFGGGINKALTITALGFPSPNVVVGRPVTFTATVNAVAPGAGARTGTVTFVVDGVVQPAAPLNAVGQAAFTMSFATSGNHSVQASYSGDAGFAPSSTAAALWVGDRNQAFIAQVYRDLLRREVDSVGLTGWSAALTSGVSRFDVVQAIENSREYRLVQVRDLYLRYLHRQADAGGLNNYADALTAGAAVEEIAASLVASPEYFANRGGGSNSGFLDALYVDVLNRPSDPGGKAGWLASLNSFSRRQVAGGFLSSSEYKSVLVRGFYQTFLRRPADVGGLNYYVNVLTISARQQVVIASLLASSEYFNSA